MKAFWDDLFFDMDECGDSREDFVKKASDNIHCDLNKIFDLIEKHEPKKAMEFIEKIKKDY
ncbi:MAG: hypothetical protein ACOC80_14250 [Petrotogales bacterium]